MKLADEKRRELVEKSKWEWEDVKFSVIDALLINPKENMGLLEKVFRLT